MFTKKQMSNKNMSMTLFRTRAVDSEKDSYYLDIIYAFPSIPKLFNFMSVCECFFHFSDKFVTPSPGTYQPEKVHPPRERYTPKYSIRSRAPQRRCDRNPSPSKYILPPVFGPRQPNKTSAASYSITGTVHLG